jgi:hypothetical protein
MTGLNESPPVCRPAGQSLKPAASAKAIAPLRFQWRIIMACKGGKMEESGPLVAASGPGRTEFYSLLLEATNHSTGGGRRL